MSYKVKTRFRDKFTKKVYIKGDSYSHEDGDRIASLIDKGYLEAPKKRSTRKKASE